MLPLKFLWVDECDSTSRVLKEKSATLIDSITAIAAGRQSAGVGRLGRRWLSEGGNLHLSIAIPQLFVPEAIKDLIPLAAGVLVAEFLQSRIGLRICLKWPNDIILDGRKVGGILCESSFLAGRMQGVIIGIGINLETIPVDHSTLEYRVGAFKGSCSQQRFSPEDDAQQLASWFALHWPDLQAERILERWSAFGIGQGHLWSKATRDGVEWFCIDRIKDDGHLQLTSVKDGQVIDVSSVQHELVWDMMRRQPLLVADVGNTSTKLALVNFCDNGHPIVEQSFNDPDTWPSLAHVARKLGVPPTVHCVSVNPTAWTDLHMHMNRLGLLVRPIEKRPVRLTKSNYNLPMLGVDRWALLELLLYRHHRAEVVLPFIVISCGTATTIDVIDNQGCHLGGYILAGIQTSLDAISERGAMLPRSIDIAKSASLTPWPVESRSAMAEAAVSATAAFVHSERARLARHCGVRDGDVCAYITGGFAHHVADRLVGQGFCVEDDLVLKGTSLLALNGR
jgi:biotin-[acetyl-CoA-carboxylase] ligase BirA-like protein